MDKRVLLLSGAMAAGKTTIAGTIRDRLGFEKISSSGYLLQQLDPLELFSDLERRTALQELGDVLDRETDYRWIVDRVALPSVLANPDQHAWYVDAVRKTRQVVHFRAAFDGQIRHIHLTAPEGVLRQRFADDPERRGQTYDVVVAHANEQAARGLGAQADHVFDTTVTAPDDIVAIVQDLWAAT
jgi:adenylosuccinate synthase